MVNNMAYTSTKQVLDLIGLSNNVNHETLATGDGTTSSIDLDNENVIASSYTVYYGDTNSNTFTDLTETEDYTIDKNKGKLVLTTTGLSKTDEKVIYAKYVWCEPFTDDEVAAQISFADSEVNEMTGRKWDTPEDFTEEIDYEQILRGSDYPIYATTEDRTSEKLSDEYVLVSPKYRPLASVTKIEFYDIDGDEITDAELDSDSYPGEWEWYSYGKIMFKDYSPLTAAKKVKVTGTYGLDVTPNKIIELSGWLTGLRLYMNLSGGSYNDVTSYSMGGATVSIGEPYINIKEFMTQANRRVEQLMRWIGQKTVFTVV